MNTLKKFLIVSTLTFVVYTSLFAIIYIFKLNQLILQSEDYIGSTVLPFSILKDHTFTLDKYHDVMIDNYPQPDDKTLTPYYLREANGHYYSIRPVLTSLLAMPVYIVPYLLNTNVDIETIRIMSRIGGAFITALSAGFFYLILQKYTSKKELRILLLVIYAFGTNSLSTSSQGLWQHGTSQLLLSIAFLLILNKRYLWSALFFGLSIIGRPTNLLSFVVFGAYILFNNIGNISELKNLKTLKEKARTLTMYVLIGALPVVAETIFNKVVLGTADNAGYSEQLNGWRANIFEGFMGLWISPSKGILINSPIFIFLFPQFYASLKYLLTRYKLLLNESLTTIKLGINQTSDLYAAMTIIVILHTLIMGKWYSWYGGYSWGYRMASDVLPFMVLLLIPPFEKYLQKPAYKTVIYLLTSLSIFLQAISFIFYDGIWHTIYDGKHPFWLWSIKDSEFAFDFRRVLFKLKLIESPFPKPSV